MLTTEADAPSREETLETLTMLAIQHKRRMQRRAESRLFEAVEAADAGDLRLAHDLLDRATTPRRARPSRLTDERAWLSTQTRCTSPVLRGRAA